MKLSAANLTLTAGTRTLCRDLALAISGGEVWGVLGCNGSGKTTLLHALAGLKAAPGVVEIDGRPLASFARREFGRTLGMLLQREDEPFWGSVRDYVMLGRYPHARSLFGTNADDEAACDGALRCFDLDSLQDHAYVTLSGGERQRARLAQLWAQQPPLMLLDEPLQHLDLKHQLRTLELIRAAASERGAGIALVLHDLQYAHRCDRVLMLYGDGRYVAGTAAQLLQPATLSELYGCGIRACGEGADAHFVPVI